MAMGKDDYQHFVCIVAGDNPDSLIKEYDSNIKVERRQSSYCRR